MAAGAPRRPGAFRGSGVWQHDKTLNAWSAVSGLFDGVLDFDKAADDPATGEMKAEFVPESTTGGPGDKPHPNRAGYLAMGNAVDLEMVMGKAKELRPTAQKK